MLCMKTYVHLRSYLTQFSLELEKFRPKDVGKLNTHILRSITFLRKPWHLWDNVEKYCTAGQATEDNIIWRMRIACWITEATNTHWVSIILIVFHNNSGNANAPLYYFLNIYVIQQDTQYLMINFIHNIQ